MKNDFFKNNQVLILGEIISDFTYSHEVMGESFYMLDIKVQRLSGNYDVIPVVVSERLIDVNESYVGMLICVNGQFRSYNRHEERKNKLVLSVFAREIFFVEEMEESSKTNQIYLDGYICKEPIYRKTPYGREITDLLIAVNRPYSKTDYIPCIAWGRNARYASQLEVGTRIQLEGRMQSREYVKKFDDGTQETRTAYEVSVSRIDVVESEETE